MNKDTIRQAPVSFTCDYNEGAHPEILRRLLETNMLQEPGYGSDRFTQSAIAKIRQATCCPNADVVFLVGGTQVVPTQVRLQKWKNSKKKRIYLHMWDFFCIFAADLLIAYHVLRQLQKPHMVYYDGQRHRSGAVRTKMDFLTKKISL